MPRVDGAVVDQAGWPHRLVERDGWWVLQKQDGDGWEDLHELDDRAHSRPDGTADTRIVASEQLGEVLESLDVVLTTDELEALLRVY